MSPRRVEVLVLAERPELIEQVGLLRWREWGYQDPSPQSWIEVTAAEAGPDQLPITLVATASDDHVLAAVALGQSDDEMTDGERDGRSPWLIGMVVAEQDRGQGIGRLLLSSLEGLAVRGGHRSVWVATGQEAVGFYQRCGWREVQQLTLSSTGIETTILRRDLEG